eukprot:Sspe_Gene.70621::Locus_41707_Transcript_1_1_Confidence_1.000_Length_973::g.70621::m.70621
MSTKTKYTNPAVIPLGKEALNKLRSEVRVRDSSTGDRCHFGDCTVGLLYYLIDPRTAETVRLCLHCAYTTGFTNQKGGGAKLHLPPTRKECPDCGETWWFYTPPENDERKRARAEKQGRYARCIRCVNSIDTKKKTYPDLELDGKYPCCCNPPTRPVEPSPVHDDSDDEEQ